MSDNRIVSLVPSGTEIVCALGFESQLVGRSHECDFPESVKALPVCTEPRFNPEGASLEVDQRVKEVLSQALSVYRVYADRLKALRPSIIITQSQCEVCAVDLREVQRRRSIFWKKAACSTIHGRFRGALKVSLVRFCFTLKN